MILEAPRVPANAGAPAVRPATAGSGAPVSLPRHYGIDRCRLMVRDPQCIHAYWEIRPETMDRARGDLGDDWEGTRRILRVHGIPISGDTTDPPADSFDLDLEEDASNCYVPIPRPNRGYRVDVGLLTRAGLFYPLASSNTVIAPRNGGSPNRTERWVPPPAAARGGEQAQSAVVHRPLASGPETPPSEPAAAGALREDFSGAGRLAEGLAGAALFESGRGLIPPGPGIPPAAVAPSSPAGAIGAAAQHREAEFRFVLDTELVVYGATEPGAKVTLQGKPVRLRSDGTFSLRFQLPDGEQVLRAEAVSADGRFVRVITPEIRRRTTSEERTEEAGREVETSGDPSDDPGAAGYRKDDTERNGERED
jgi:hypothetical protein